MVMLSFFRTSRLHFTALSVEKKKCLPYSVLQKYSRCKFNSGSSSTTAHETYPTKNNVEPIHLPRFPLAQASVNTRTSPELLSTGILFLTQPIQHNLLIPSEHHSTDYPPLHPTPTASSMTLR